MSSPAAPSGDPVTIDQLRVFLAVIEEGSFSGAARRLGRTQSAISYSMSNLERLLGFELFDRKGQLPVATESGLALVADARASVQQIDSLVGRARSMQKGLESHLAVALDAMLPMAGVTQVLGEFQQQFPWIELTLRMESLGSVMNLVEQGECHVGISELLDGTPRSLSVAAIGSIELIFVVAPSHPLAQFNGVIPKHELARHVQLVITDRSGRTQGVELSVYTDHVWRLADFSTKQSLLLAGFGFGSLPVHMAGSFLERGDLVAVELEHHCGEAEFVRMCSVIRRVDPPGPAACWIMNRLSHICGGNA